MLNVSQRIKPKREKLNLAFPINQEAILLAVPKCGSTTIRSAIGQWRTTKTALPLDEAAAYGTRIAVIRNPVTRLRSAWNHIWKQHSWDEFVDHVLADPDWDIHTARYAERAELANVLLTTEMLDHGWTMLREVFPEIPELGKKLNERGSFVPGVVPRSHEILAAYREDFDAWTLCRRNAGILLK